MSSVELKGFRGLTGLDTLLDDSKNQAPKQNISNLSVKVLSSGKYQPRTDINNDSLHDLAASIKAQEIIQPLIVRSVARAIPQPMASREQVGLLGDWLTLDILFILVLLLG